MMDLARLPSATNLERAPYEEQMLHGSSERVVPDCWRILKDALRGRSKTETYLSLRAFSLIAISFRLLHLSELYAAVITPVRESSGPLLMTNMTLALTCPDDLLKLCSSVIAIRGDGRVDFAQTAMNDFLFRYHLLDAGVCHEIMTKICLHHLHPAESETQATLMETNVMILPDTLRDAFDRYARENWHQHYRLCEEASNDLPECLRQLIETDVVSILSGKEYLSIEIQQIILSVGLKVSILHSFPILEQLCRQHLSPMTNRARSIKTLLSYSKLWNLE